jgi:SET domain-containing protein
MKRRTSKAFVYLGASSIHGLGCFADIDIRKDELVRVWDGKDSRFIPVARAHASPQVKLIKRFGIRTARGYWVPLDFLRISTGWYMNHSADPNIASGDGDVTYYALRDIEAGEELTMDYRLMDEEYDNLDRDEVVPASSRPKSRRRR